MKKIIPLAAFLSLGIAACIHFTVFSTLPEDIPIMVGTKVLDEISVKSPQARQWLVEVDKDRRTFFDDYKSHLKSKGWTVRVERPDFLMLHNGESGFMISADQLEDGRTRAELFIGKM